MGCSQSQEKLRSSHFQRPGSEAEDDTETYDDEDLNERKISISNRMVERLVEDATLAGRAEAKASHAHVTPRGDYKDKICMERLRCLDENHSQRWGLTMRDMETAAARIEKRIERMVSSEPVCAERHRRVVDCYNEARVDGDYVKCWGLVEDFKRCVNETSASRVEERTQRDARETARRSRHCAHAREKVLKDLGPDDTSS